MNQPSVRLHRIGSDPELAFWNMKGALVPADQFVSENREIRLNSWIGTDGHAATAEIRPAPAHNVGWHLGKIADAMAAISTFLKGHNYRNKRDIIAVAQPIVNRETMGGHVHVSLWYDSLLSEQAIKLGYIYNRGESYRLADDQHPWTNVDRGVFNEYWARAMKFEELTVDEVIGKLHYLLGPFENAIWYRARDVRVAMNDPLYRVPPQHPPEGVSSKGAYLWVEYRWPSSWLHDPGLAYCYLALAKLVILNWWNLPSYPQLAAADRDNRHFAKEISRNFYIAQFLERYQKLLENPNFRTSNDLLALTRYVTAWVEWKPVLKGGLNPINFEAWAAVKLPGEEAA